MPVHLRPATSSDAAAVAAVWIRSRSAAAPRVPSSVHPEDDMRRYAADVLVAQRETWVAESDHQIVAMMVLDGADVDHLYVDPKWWGRGIGSRLVRLAQRERPAGLELWTFQTNLDAQRFYERHGFVELFRTDGADNEEGAPDIRYGCSPR